MLKHPALLVALICFFEGSAAGQSAQLFSVQGSALYQTVSGEAFQFSEGDLPSGYGGEIQLRYTPGALSFGTGVQGVRHSLTDSDGDERRLDIVGVFLEPRYVIVLPGAGSFAPYLSARLALTSLKYEIPGFDISGDAVGQTLNGGGGILLRLGSRVNLDVGATYGYTNFGTFEFAGNPEGTFETGSGTNLIARAGLAVGIGR